MKSLTRNLSAASLLFASGHATAEVIYSNQQNIAIPTTYDGTYIDVDGGNSPSTSTFTGWDLNAYMGGVYLANNTLFQPGRTTASDMGTLRNFAVGATIDTGMLLGTGMGGSINHLGTTFTDGQEGYLGFKIGGNYGWMRVIFTNNTAGAVIKDWAYDNSGAAVNVGRVQQSAAVSGAQTVTLSPASGESFALGSQITNTDGNINSVVKTGAGTTTLNAINTYTGSTTITAGTLALGAAGSIGNTSSVSLGTAGTFDVSAKSGGYTVANLTGSGAVFGSLTVSTQLAIGNSAGTVNFQDLGLGDSATSVFELGGGAGDLANISGSLALDGGLTLNLLDGQSYVLGQVYTLFGYTAANNLSGIGTFDLLADGDVFTAAGGGWQIDYDATSPGSNLGTGDRFVTVTAVPEPGAALIGGLGLLALLRRRRN